MTRLLTLCLFATLLACSPPVEVAEGQNPGDCTDGADNDGDGDFDCDDRGCFGAPECKSANANTNGDNTDTNGDGVPTAWTCEPAEYEDGNICHCNCGALDPDCADSSAPVNGCSTGQTCGARGRCVTEQTNGATGWTCPPADQGDGSVCDCNCGAPDPDCDVVPRRNYYPRGCEEALCSDSGECVDVGYGDHYLMIDDTTTDTMSCDSTTDPGADIYGVALRSPDGEVEIWGQRSRSSSIGSYDYGLIDVIDGSAQTSCPEYNRENIYSLNCGGWIAVTFEFDGYGWELLEGMQLTVYEWGDQCPNGDSIDTYTISTCDNNSAPAGLDRSAWNCTNVLGTGLSGESTVEITY